MVVNVIICYRGTIVIIKNDKTEIFQMSYTYICDSFERPVARGVSILARIVRGLWRT